MLPLLLVVAAVSASQGPRAPLTEHGGRPGDTTYVALNDLMRSALAENLELRMAIAESRGAASYATSARSRFDPVVNIGGESGSGGIGGQLTGVLPTGTGYLLGSVAPSRLPGEPIYPNAIVASINQPVLRGFGYQSSRNSIHAVDEGIAASHARLTRVRDEVVTDITVSYAVLVERHRHEAIAIRSLKRAQDLLDNYTQLREMQKITEVELITAKLGVTSRRATLLEYRKEREEAQDALLFAVYGARAQAALAATSAVVMPRDTAITMPTVPALADAITAALAARQDVEAARRDVARNKYQSAYAKNTTLPTLNVQAAYASTLIDTSSRIDSKRQGQWSAGIVLSRPLRNSSAEAEVERASAADQQASLALAQAENVVRADVRAAYRDITIGKEHAQLATDASRLAQQQYEGERGRLDLGLSDIFRVLQYEEQVAQVEHTEATAWLGLATSVARYKSAMGGAAAEYQR